MAGLLAPLFYNLPASTQENAEASRDAGSAYHEAVRIRLTGAVERPKGVSGYWAGRLGGGDGIDAYKFTPTPMPGQLLIIAANSDSGEVTLKLLDRKTGVELARSQRQDGVALVLYTVEKTLMLQVEGLPDDAEYEYSVSAILTKPEQLGLSKASQGKAGASLSKKPEMPGLPDGFSLIIPKVD